MKQLIRKLAHVWGSDRTRQRGPVRGWRRQSRDKVRRAVKCLPCRSYVGGADALIRQCTDSRIHIDVAFDDNYYRNA